MSEKDLPTDAELVRLIDLIDAHKSFIDDDIELLIGAGLAAGSILPNEWVDVTDRTNAEVPV